MKKEAYIISESLLLIFFSFFFYSFMIGLMGEYFYDFHGIINLIPFLLSVIILLWSAQEVRKLFMIKNHQLFLVRLHKDSVTLVIMSSVTFIGLVTIDGVSYGFNLVSSYYTLLFPLDLLIFNFLGIVVGLVGTIKAKPEKTEFKYIEPKAEKRKLKEILMNICYIIYLLISSFYFGDVVNHVFTGIDTSFKNFIPLLFLCLMMILPMIMIATYLFIYQTSTSCIKAQEKYSIIFSGIALFLYAGLNISLKINPMAIIESGQNMLYLTYTTSIKYSESILLPTLSLLPPLWAFVGWMKKNRIVSKEIYEQK